MTHPGPPDAEGDPPWAPGQPAGLPDGVDPLGVPRAGSGKDAFVVTLGVVVALLVLIVTLGWVVFHRLTLGA